MSRHKILDFNQPHKADLLFSIIFLVLIAISGGCKSIYSSGWINPPVQPVSGPIVIGSEWIEIVPPTPLIPYGSIQSLLIGVQNYDKKESTADPATGKVLNLSDGKKTKIDVIVIDDMGTAYELRISGSGGIGGGISFNRQYTVEIIDGKKETNLPDFPSERIFTKVKIRSDIPINCDRIEWVGENNK